MDFLSQFGDANGHSSLSGEVSGNHIEELRKAITAGYGTDTSTFTNGAAFRVQSLDSTMYATIQEQRHFQLINSLVKSNAGATVDEWSEQFGVGGVPGSSTNSELGDIPDSTGDYRRRFGQVKYLMTRREVSFVSTLGNNIVQSEVIEQQAGSIQLLTDAEYLSFFGDDNIVPTEFPGIFAQLEAGVASGAVDSGNIIDARGSALDKIDMIAQASAQVSAIDNYGTATHIFLSKLTQNDLDISLDPAFRVSLTDVKNGINLGSPVRAVRTTDSDIVNMPDVFIPDSNKLVPYQLISAFTAANAVTLDTLKPQSATPVAAADAASKFESLHAGNYFYLVTGLNARGQSTGLITTQVAVAAGDKVTLTIAASAANQEVGYAVYRSRKNGTNAVADFRLIKRIKKTNTSTVFVDLNVDIPGTTKAFILNMKGDAISWRQLLPMMKFQLYPTNKATLPWAQLLFGYLRMTKLRQHAVIKNILPSTSQWKPFA